jgi:hypothetical protein
MSPIFALGLPHGIEWLVVGFVVLLAVLLVPRRY